MQFLAQLLKRVPVREVAPKLLPVLALGGILGHGAPIFRDVIKLIGSYWG